jgi:hypothetical protein
MLYYAPQAMRSFGSLYYWRNQYDEATKRYIFDASPPGDGDQLNKFQLPSARVGLTEWFTPANGAPAPDQFVNWNETRSGDIEIFASKIVLCDKCIEAVNSEEVYPPEGDGGDVNRGYFFEVGGLKGGRGGAGTPPMCTYFHPAAGTFSANCSDWYAVAGGVSGMPGRGGDAGSIPIHFVNRTASAAEAKLLTDASDIRAGFPADFIPERTPSVVKLNSASDRRIFGIHKIFTENDFKTYLVGKNGNIFVDSISTTSMINTLSTLLTKYELGGNYYLDLLASHARDNPDSFLVSPSEITSYLLENELTPMQYELAASFEGNAASSTDSLKMPTLLETMKCNPNKYYNLTELSKSYIRELCNFKFDGVDNAMTRTQAYFYQTGGLIRSVPNDLNTILQHEETIEELSEIRKLIVDVIDETSKTRLLMFDQVTDAQKRNLVENLTKLQQQLAALQAAIPASASFGDTLKQLVEIGKNFSQGIVDIYSGNWFSAGQEISAGGQSLGSLIVDENRWPDTNNASSEERLKLEIEETRIAVQKYFRDVTKQKAEIISLQNANLRKLLDLRSAIRRREGEARLRVGDLLRVTLIDYLSPPISRKQEFLDNLSNLKQFIDGSLSEARPLNATRPLNLETAVEILRGRGVGAFSRA